MPEPGISPYGIDVVHDKDECRGHEGEGDDSAAGDEAGEDGQEGRDEEDEELKLNDPPLVLELVLWLSGIANNICGLLRCEDKM